MCAPLRTRSEQHTSSSACAAGPGGAPLLVAPPVPGCLRAAAAAARAGSAADPFAGGGAPDWRAFGPARTADSALWPPPRGARLQLLWPEGRADAGGPGVAAPATCQAAPGSPDGAAC